MIRGKGHELAREASIVREQLPVYRHEHLGADVMRQARRLAKIHVADDVVLGLAKEVAAIDRQKDHLGSQRPESLHLAVIGYAVAGVVHAHATELEHVSQVADEPT